MIALRDSAQVWVPTVPDIDTILSEAGFPTAQLNKFVASTERNQMLDEADYVLSNALSIDKVQSLIDTVRELAGRKFTVLLMDDAALTLTPIYLIDFLDIVRSLKSTTLAPKASVYPGTTEVSPKFHQGQDSIAIPVWVSVADDQYDVIMQDIAHKRVKNLETIPADVQVMLRFAAFGISRAYLTI